MVDVRDGNGEFSRKVARRCWPQLRWPGKQPGLRAAQAARAATMPQVRLRRRKQREQHMVTRMCRRWTMGSGSQSRGTGSPSGPWSVAFSGRRSTASGALLENFSRQPSATVLLYCNGSKQESSSRAGGRIRSVRCYPGHYKSQHGDQNASSARCSDHRAPWLQTYTIKSRAGRARGGRAE